LRLAWPGVPAQTARVTKLCILAGSTIVGSAGWYLGELVGFEFLGCFLVSCLGSLVGVWVGWKVARRFD